MYRLVCKFASAFEKCVSLTLLFWICRLVTGKIKEKHSWNHLVCLGGMKVQLSFISKQIYKLLHISLKIEQVYNLFQINFTVKPIQGGRLLLLQCSQGRLHSQFNPVACDGNLLSFLWPSESTPKLHFALQWYYLAQSSSLWEKHVGTTQTFLYFEQQTKYFSSIGMRDGAWRVLDSNQIISLSIPNARHVKRIPQLKTFQSTQNPLSFPLWMCYYFVEWVQRDLWLTSCLMASIGYSISRTYNSLQKVRILHIPLLYWA